MLGQLRIEFIFAVVVFSVIIFFVVSQVNVLFSSILTDSSSDISKTTIINTLNILLEDVGDPTNWDTKPEEEIKRVGLATTPYILSKEKINRLNTTCNLLNDYSLGAYFLEIYNQTNKILSCGVELLEAPSSVSTKYVVVDDSIGNITLKLW